MKISDFKRLVANIPDEFDDFTVVMSSDPEGNSFEEMTDIDLHLISGKSGIYYDPHSNEINCYNEDDYDDHDEFFEHINDYEQLEPCVVLWP